MPAAMLHDPKTFAHLGRRMRKARPVREAEETPAIAELIERIDKALAARSSPQG